MWSIWIVEAAAFVCAVIALWPSEALAQVNTPMGAVLCSVVAMIYGNLGRGLATLAIIVVGIGATLGKTSWAMATTVGVGIAVIFNAHLIVGALNAGQFAYGCVGP
jgi:type IV secretory pathway VirB2 component (pilin)